MRLFPANVTAQQLHIMHNNVTQRLISTDLYFFIIIIIVSLLSAALAPEQHYCIHVARTANFSIANI